MRGSMHEVGIFLNHALPARLRHLHTDQQRQSERYRCRISGRLNWGGNEPERSGVVVNYSYNGMAVQSPVAARIDEVFHFRWLVSGVKNNVTALALAEDLRGRAIAFDDLDVERLGELARSP